MVWVEKMNGGVDYNVLVGMMYEGVKIGVWLVM